VVTTENGGGDAGSESESVSRVFFASWRPYETGHILSARFVAGGESLHLAKIK
jgi:hypothetical protein